MRTVNEINADLVPAGALVNDLAAQMNAAKAQQRALWDERKLAEAAVEFVKLDPTARDEYVAKVEAEEVARAEAEEAARLAAEEEEVIP
jgi:hypothetical protein